MQKNPFWALFACGVRFCAGMIGIVCNIIGWRATNSPNPATKFTVLRWLQGTMNPAHSAGFTCIGLFVAS
jgi:hypothetical protein